MKKAKRDLWIGIVFLVLSALYFAGSFSIKRYSGFGDQIVDSKFMPRVLAAMMAVLSVIQMWTASKQLKGLRKEAGQEEEEPEETGTVTASSVEDAKKNFDEDAYVKGSDIKDILVIGVLLLVYAGTFKLLGFAISSMIFLLGSILYLSPKEKRNWFWTIGLSVVIPFAVYFLFVYGFKMKLPAGILNF